MEDTDVITISSSLPENSVEITSTEAAPLGESSFDVAESIEVVSTDESIICLDDDETTEELPPDDTFFTLFSTISNFPVVMPFTSDFPESPPVSYSNDNDEDFSIVFEKKVPPLEVEILENYRSPNTQTKKKLRIQRNTRPSDQGEHQNTNQQEVAEQTNPALDDSVCVVDDSPKVVHVTPSVDQSTVLSALQRSILDSTERKKRKIECGVCFDGPDEIEKRDKSVVSTICGHIFCSECITVSIKSFKHCPQCRKKLTMKQFHVIYV